MCSYQGHEATDSQPGLVPVRYPPTMQKIGNKNKRTMCSLKKKNSYRGDTKDK